MSEIPFSSSERYAHSPSVALGRRRLTRTGRGGSEFIDLRATRRAAPDRTEEGGETKAVRSPHPAAAAARRRPPPLAPSCRPSSQLLPTDVMLLVASDSRNWRTLCESGPTMRSGIVSSSTLGSPGTLCELRSASVMKSYCPLARPSMGMEVASESQHR